MVAPYLWIEFHVLLVTCLDTSTLDWQSMVWWGFVIGLKFGSCFHNFYERWVSHNIEGDV
jgi:hypothetical protein